MRRDDYSSGHVPTAQDKTKLHTPLCLGAILFLFPVYSAYFFALILQTNRYCKAPLFLTLESLKGLGPPPSCGVAVVDSERNLHSWARNNWTEGKDPRGPGWQRKGDQISFFRAHIHVDN